MKQLREDLDAFGLVRMQLNHKPVYLRPKFYAVQNICSVITGDCSPVEMSVESSCGREIKCVGISKGGKTVGCALWFCDRVPDSSLERTKVSFKIHGFEERPTLCMSTCLPASSIRCPIRPTDAAATMSTIPTSHPTFPFGTAPSFSLTRLRSNNNRRGLPQITCET